MNSNAIIKKMREDMYIFEDFFTQNSYLYTDVEKNSQNYFALNFFKFNYTFCMEMYQQVHGTKKFFIPDKRF